MKYDVTIADNMKYGWKSLSVEIRQRDMDTETQWFRQLADQDGV